MVNKKERIILWGRGYHARDVLDALDFRFCDIVGWIDKKIGKGSYEDCNFILPEELGQIEYDYVIVTVKDSDSIKKKIEKLKIDFGNVIFFWECDIDKYAFFNSKVLRLKSEIRKLNYWVANAPYEVENIKKPYVKSIENTLRSLINGNASLCRFGDGEYRWILKTRIQSWFQDVNDKLTDRLTEIIESKDDNILIAISDIFGSLDDYLDVEKNYYREFLNTDGLRGRLGKYIDCDREYYNAFVTRPYWHFSKEKRRDSYKYFDLWKELFRDKDVLIVEGEYVRMGAGNDLLSGCRSISRILCPYRNAFDYYDEILNTILSSSEDKPLILISLGPTATVLSYDLAKLGYRALDIGQLDIEYEWFLRNANDRIRIEGKGVAESDDGKIPTIKASEEFRKQVVAEIYVQNPIGE